jgi:DNA-binding transcriptional MerR regulator
MHLMEKKEFYSQSDLKKIFSHIPANTLLFWAKEGLLKWTEETRDARGIHRKYSLDDIVRVAFVEELLSIGYPIKMADALLNNLFDTGERGIYLITKTLTGRVDQVRDLSYCDFWEELPEELASLRGASSIHIIDVGQITLNIKSRLEGL